MANKSRLLFILDYLKNHTDTNRMISADSLMKLCGENGLTISRNTLRDDIAALIYSGCGIECVHSDGRAYYYMADRPFSKAELKLLIDAVASSNLLTQGDSERMIEKLKGLINEEQRPSLTYMMSQRKAEDETAVRKIGLALEAADMKRKIAFQYWTVEPEKGRVLRNGGERYVVSVYCIFWRDDRYYLTGFCDNRGEIRTFRMDRIKEIEITGDESASDGTFDISGYLGASRDAYTEGDEIEAEIVCDNRYLQNVVDDYPLVNMPVKYGDGKFKVTIKALDNSHFYSWVFKYLSGIEITNPPEIKNKYRKMLFDAIGGMMK